MNADRGTVHAMTTIGEAAPAAEVLHLTVNGAAREVAVGTTIAGLIEQLGLSGKRVAVERNKAIAPQDIVCCK